MFRFMRLKMLHLSVSASSCFPQSSEHYNYISMQCQFTLSGYKTSSWQAVLFFSSSESDVLLTKRDTGAGNTGTCLHLYSCCHHALFPVYVAVVSPSVLSSVSRQQPQTNNEAASDSDPHLVAFPLLERLCLLQHDSACSGFVWTSKKPHSETSQRWERASVWDNVGAAVVGGLGAASQWRMKWPKVVESNMILTNGIQKSQFKAKSWFKWLIRLL